MFQSTPVVASRRDYERCIDILDRLIADKQIDVLKGILAGDVTWGELLYADARQELVGTKILANIKLGRPLWPMVERKKPIAGAIAETLPAMGGAESTRNRYEDSLNAFRDQTLVSWPATPMRVRDLERVKWAELSEKWPNSAADWNHVVRAIRAFLTKYLGSTRHEFREKIGHITPMLPEDERVPDITPDVFGRVLAELPRDAQAIAMTLLLTGMRDRSEYFRAADTDLLPATYQVRIPGRRTKGKKGRYVAIDESMWTWVHTAIPAPMTYKTFMKHWHRACVAVGVGRYVETGKTAMVRKKLERGQQYIHRGHGDVRHELRKPEHVEKKLTRYEGLRPHDLRHALAQWTHDAGRSLSEIKVMLGHSSIAMSERYARTKSQRAVAGTAATIISQVVK